MVVCADDDLAGLCREFPGFDRGLLEGMLADQGGDVAEVHACLRVEPHTLACSLDISYKTGIPCAMGFCLSLVFG